MTQKDAIRWCRKIFYLSMCALTVGFVIMALTIWVEGGWLRPSATTQTVGGWFLACGSVIGGTTALLLLTTDRA